MLVSRGEDVGIGEDAAQGAAVAIISLFRAAKSCGCDKGADCGDEIPPAPKPGGGRTACCRAGGGSP
jgi:hypothetical protein